MISSLKRIGCAVVALIVGSGQNFGGDLHTAAPTINVWYGPSQTFGTLGVPQRRVSILGNVSDPGGIDSLYYSLNGGQRIQLSIGPDTRRLSRLGDFNIDIPYSSLAPGSNAVQITAKNFSGGMTQQSVSLTAAPPWSWPLPYTVGWSNAQSLKDSGQVVDGLWGFVGDGIGPLEPGYDRLIAIGDTTWTDYEALMEFTVYGIDSTATAFDATNGGPGFGLLFRWNGHTMTPAFSPPIVQPVSGYLPLGAIGWYHWRTGYGLSGQNQWEILGNNSLELKSSNSSPAIQYGTHYYLKMHVVTTAGVGGLYRLKVWRTSDSEPGAWLLTGQENLTGPQHGSLLLIAHHVDVTIRSVSVTPINPDNLPPILSNIQAEAGGTASTVRWDTDEQATNTVLYGLTTALTDTVILSSGLTTHHEVNLTGLSPSTTYHYQVRSSDNLGNEVVSQGDLTFFTAPLPAPSIVVSDDMNDQSLQPIWNFVNPFPPGGSSVQNNGATTHIVVPGGAAHEIWTGGYLAPRIMQTANNTDLEITVRFLSGLSGTSSSSQSQGLVFESDPNNCLRFDFTTGLDDSTRIFAAGFANGFSSPAVKVSRNISAYNQSPLYLKVRRESNVWTELYSFDGVTWNNGATFYYALPVNKVGVFAGNGGSAPQQFDCLIDEVAAPLPATARLVTPSPNAADVPLPPALTWESLQSTSYQVQLSQDSTFVGTVVYDSVVTVPTAQPSSLAGLTRYFWRARGKNANGNGSYSGVQSFTTAVLVPPAPLLAAPGNGALGQPLRPTLRWFNANGASSYWLQVSTDSLFSALVFSDSAIVDSFGVPASLSYETEYYWRVRAKNINGAGPFSEKRTFTTSIGPVVLWSPSNHTADADTTGLLFTWRRMTSATSYRFELATDSTFATGLIKDVSGIVDTFRVVSGLASNRQHYWRVRGANGGGSGPASPVWDFSTLAPLGVREAGVLPHAYQLYQNYPNPFNPTTEITFDIAAASAVEITIHDLLGRIVRRLVSEQKAPGQYRVTWEGTDDTGAGVASGVYLYRIQAGSFVQTRKLILLR